MSTYFYDGQVKKYLTQFIRTMSNFSYKDAKGQLVQIPVRYGDMNRQAAHILKKNSENTINSAPFIACYIKDLQFDRARMQDPTFVSKMQIRERAYNANGDEYLPTQGANYTVERIMPAPYQITFAADIWTTNTNQKFQIWEQIAVLFIPSLEIQTTDNYIDWTSLSVLELVSQTWSSRAVPQGVEQDIEIVSMVFTAPIWITPPAKVKKLGIITKIIANVFAVNAGTIQSDFTDIDEIDLFSTPSASVVITPGNFDLLVLNNTASLINAHATNQVSTSWSKLLDLYPGQFRAGLSQLRLTTPTGSEIIAFISVDPSDSTRMMLNVDQDTVPSNTILDGRGTIDAIIDPLTFNPSGVIVGTRYLILDNINHQIAEGLGPIAWKNTDGTDAHARANDIIQWSGTNWIVLFHAAAVSTPTYMTNSYTGVQYQWSNGSWSKSFEGIYDHAAWRVIL